MTGQVIDLMEALKASLAKKQAESTPPRVAELSQAINESLAESEAETVASADLARRVPPPRPGIYTGVPYEDYAAWDAANSSTLREFDRSPAHALEHILRPQPETPATLFGHALHTGILEPDLLERRFVRAIKVDRRTKVGKEAWAAFLIEAAGRTPLSAGEWDDCLAMRDAVWSAGPVADLLKDGLKEVCLVWIDAETGLACKARLDHLGHVFGWSFIVDVKSAADGSEGAFSRAVARYGYHEQAAFYLDGAAALAPRARRFLHLVAEKERPFCSAFYELDDQALEQGRRNARRHLRAYAACKASGVWPGYPDGITPLSIPRWAVSQHEEESEA